MYSLKLFVAAILVFAVQASAVTPPLTCKPSISLALDL